jgi:hypothetical protein
VIDRQATRDAHALAVLADSKYARQEAIVEFVLGCQQMARELKQMCDARRCLSHPVDNLEDVASLIERAIAGEFRRKFGRPLFLEEVGAANV